MSYKQKQILRTLLDSGDLEPMDVPEPLFKAAVTAPRIADDGLPYVTPEVRSVAIRAALDTGLFRSTDVGLGDYTNALQRPASLGGSAPGGFQMPSVCTGH